MLLSSWIDPYKLLTYSTLIHQGTERKKLKKKERKGLYKHIYLCTQWQSRCLQKTWSWIPIRLYFDHWHLHQYFLYCKNHYNKELKISFTARRPVTLDTLTTFPMLKEEKNKKFTQCRRMWKTLNSC